MALIITREGDTFFRFQLDGGDIKRDSQPRLSNINTLSDFKTGTGANMYQRVELANIEVVDEFGATGTFTGFADIPAFRDKLKELKFFDGAAGLGSGGVDRFDNLLDGFSYAGNNGKIPIVNESLSKLDPIEFTQIESSTDLDDMPSTLIPLKIPQVDALGAVYNLVDMPSEPQQFFNASGFIVYADGGVAQPYVSGQYIVSNDQSGIRTDYTYKPYGVNNVWDSINSQFYVTELRLGDKVLFNFNIGLITTATDQNVIFKLKYAIGTGSETEVTIYDNTIPTIGANSLYFDATLEMSIQDIIDGRIELILESDAALDLIVNDFTPNITRRDVNEVVINDNDSLATHYKGEYNAITNFPLLVDNVGNLGDELKVTVAGTQDFGSGSITFGVDDIVFFNGLVWSKKVDNNQGGGGGIPNVGIADKNGVIQFSVTDVLPLRLEGGKFGANETWVASPKEAEQVFVLTGANNSIAEVFNYDKPFNHPRIYLDTLTGDLPTINRVVRLLDDGIYTFSTALTCILNLGFESIYQCKIILDNQATGSLFSTTASPNFFDSSFNMPNGELEIIDDAFHRFDMGIININLDKIVSTSILVGTSFAASKLGVQNGFVRIQKLRELATAGTCFYNIEGDLDLECLELTTNTRYSPILGSTGVVKIKEVKGLGGLKVLKGNNYEVGDVNTTSGYLELNDIGTGASLANTVKVHFNDSTITTPSGILLARNSVGHTFISGTILDCLTAIDFYQPKDGIIEINNFHADIKAGKFLLVNGVAANLTIIIRNSSIDCNAELIAIGTATNVTVIIENSIINGRKTAGAGSLITGGASATNSVSFLNSTVEPTNNTSIVDNGTIILTQY